MLRFHSRSFELLGIPPRISEKNRELLISRESELEISLPASVREWYSCEGSVSILRQFSNDDVPVEVEHLGAVVPNWYGSGPRDFVNDQLLWIMGENQGVANWAVMLDGTEDPAIVVDVDNSPNERWERYSSTFSDFVYTRIWDFLPSGAEVGACEPTLPSTVLEALRIHFHEHPSTQGQSLCRQYRFSHRTGKILIWQVPGQVDWFLRAANVDSLVALLGIVIPIAKFTSPLFDIDEEGGEALKLL